MDDHLDGRVRDRPAEVVRRVDRRLDGVAAAVLLPFRRRHLHQKLGELVLLEAEELRRAAMLILRFEVDVIHAEGHGVGEGELGPETAEGAELRDTRGDLLPARVEDLVVERLAARRHPVLVLADARQHLPLHGLPRTVRGTIGERVDAPLSLIAAAAAVRVVIELVIRLARAAGDGDERHAVPLHGFDARQPFGVRLRVALDEAVVSDALPQVHACVRDGLAGDHVRDEDVRVRRTRVHEDVRVGHEDQRACALPFRGCGQDVRAEGQARLETEALVARLVLAGVVRVERPLPHDRPPFDGDEVGPLPPIVVAGVFREVDADERQADALDVAPGEEDLLLGFRQERAAHVYAHRGLEDRGDRALRLFAEARGAGGELRDDATIDLERLDEVAALGERRGIEMERVVVQIALLSDGEDLFEELEGALVARVRPLHGNPLREEPARAHAVLGGLGDLHGVDEHFARHVPADALGRQLPDDVEIAAARDGEVAAAGPPVECGEVVGLRGAWVPLPSMLGVEIAERFIGLGPEPVVRPLRDELGQRLAGGVPLGRIFVRRCRIRAPRRVGQAKVHPAPLVFREGELRGLFVDFVRAAERFLGVFALRIGLQSLVGILRCRGGEGEQQEHEDLAHIGYRTRTPAKKQPEL